MKNISITLNILNFLKEKIIIYLSTIVVAEYPVGDDPQNSLLDNIQIEIFDFRVFKRVLKLDKNFHIYIHGNKELIEKGYDEKNYYKVYFKEEN